MIRDKGQYGSLILSYDRIRRLENRVKQLEELLTKKCIPLPEYPPHTPWDFDHTGE
jgi:hypothetical protein